MKPHQNEITGAYYEKKTWKDYLYIIPAFLLLALIIASAVISL